MRGDPGRIASHGCERIVKELKRSLVCGGSPAISINELTFII
jgi:hypothetical protein